MARLSFVWLAAMDRRGRESVTPWRGKLALALLVAGVVGANDVHFSLAAYDFAVFANAADAGADLHG
jgi:hypothetical protein